MIEDYSAFLADFGERITISRGNTPVGEICGIVKTKDSQASIESTAIQGRDQFCILTPSETLPPITRGDFATLANGTRLKVIAVSRDNTRWTNIFAEIG